MRPEIAEWVFPVFRKAIEIKEGLRLDEESRDFAKSHQELLALLQRPVPDAIRNEILGDKQAFDPSMTGTHVGGFYGIRYALACWLDEIFIIDSVWREEWANNTMETNLYDTRLRAHRFWDQAERALSRPGRDAIEIFFLCVMLGFRGEKVDKPRELAAWRDKVEPRVISPEYTPPPGIKLQPEVRLLKGGQAMQKWLMILSAVGMVFILVVIVVIAKLL